MDEVPMDDAPMDESLPIDPLLPEIEVLARPGANLIVEAAPGAGKTTRVPPALLSGSGEVIVLEPRRIAARMAARRVAGQMGGRVGELVGYQVRFEDTTSARTRLRFVTEGVLTRRMISDPLLNGVSVVVLDEFHERHLDTDLALALLRRLQKTARPDLSIVVMSATLDTAPVAAFLGECRVIHSEGRAFELRTEFTPYSPAPVEVQVVNAAERLLGEEPRGHILAFLPGAGEIRRTARALESTARRAGAQVLPLYGDLSPAEQDLAVAPSAIRKIVLATNIAESSVTIDGVSVVIDSGLARVATDSPWTGLPSLEIGRISKASARQRAGRAGRTGPGRAIHLFTAEDYHRRPDHDKPEILRRELSGLCLQLRAMNIDPASEMEWLDAPPAAAMEAADELLSRLGTADSELHAMARLPLHPRLARLVLSAASEEGCLAAALLSSGQRIRSLEDTPDEKTLAVYRQLRHGFRNKGTPGSIDAAVLRAFPDRVGRRGSAGSVLLSIGSSVEMKNSPSEFMVVIDPPWLAHPIEPELLVELFPDRVREVNRPEWNRQAERVERVNQLLYDQLVIDETRGGGLESQQQQEAAERLLAEKALEAGLSRFVDVEAFDQYRARLEFAAQHSALIPLSETSVEEAIHKACAGLRSFAELGKKLNVLLSPAMSAGVQALERVAPERIRLSRGRSVKVCYESGKNPSISSRLQDFFGMKETPAIANGRVPLTIHLLGPNLRTVQTTTDLGGFWERLYPQLRRELGRRYPRHAWPEDPLSS